MKEHGTLFKADMVRAILRDVDPKTQTRRLLTRHNSLVDGARASPALWDDLDFGAAWVDKGPSPAGNQGPYLKVPRRSEESVHRVYATVSPGDRFYVKETWRTAKSLDGKSPTAIADACIDAGYRTPWAPLAYEADGHRNSEWRGFEPHGDAEPGQARVSIHMPRWASRILLVVTAVRLERLQDICEADAIAEGIERREDACGDWRHYGDTGLSVDAVGSYRSLWERIHGEASWKADPWVRVFEFRRLTP